MTLQAGATVPETESQTERAEISDGAGNWKPRPKNPDACQLDGIFGERALCSLAWVEGGRLEIRFLLPNSPFHGVLILICRFHGMSCVCRAHIQLLVALAYLCLTQ